MERLKNLNLKIEEKLNQHTWRDGKIKEFEFENT